MDYEGSMPGEREAVEYHLAHLRQAEQEAREV
jgi:hypothetical protein